MIGQRGVPATFGGIERHVEELGAGLAAMGHDVTVFSRSNYQEEALVEYRGMHVRTLPTVGTKHLDAIVHSAASTLAALGHPPDIVHYHALGPGLVAPVPRLLSRSKVVLTVHGLDGERAKWGTGAQAVLGVATWMSARVPDATIVVSRALADHYLRRYRRSTFHVANGVNVSTLRPPDEIRTRWGLEAGSYLLFVGRLVEEKAPHLLVEAFGRVPTDLRLVIAGGSSFSDDYVRSLTRLVDADDRVTLLGYVYGSALEELYSNAAAFVLPSALEGLPLTLLEAAGHGVPIVASSIPPNLEVLGGDDAWLFTPGDADGLTDALTSVISQGPKGGQEGLGRLRHRVLEHYRWTEAVRQVDDIYQSLTGAATGSSSARVALR
jgi:glycosyltransferase involved in cell wall biosynthesis